MIPLVVGWIKNAIINAPQIKTIWHFHMSQTHVRKPGLITDTHPEVIRDMIIMNNH